jgi:hypothetical protein
MDIQKKVEVEPVKPVAPPVKVEPVKVEPIKVETKVETKPEVVVPVEVKH